MCSYNSVELVHLDPLATRIASSNSDYLRSTGLLRTRTSSPGTILLSRAWARPPTGHRPGTVKPNMRLGEREVRTSSPYTDTLSSYRLGATLASFGPDPPS
jgi:hypothetical protein